MKTYQIIALATLTAASLGQLSADAQTVKGWGSGAKGGPILKDLTGTQNVGTGGIVSGASGYAVGSKAKRGWSPQATGAAIGTGAGAAVGAVINKRNRVVGGVIGGVVGGAAGYAIGKNKDNKNKAEAARVAAAQKAAAEKAAADRAVAEKADADRAAAKQAEQDRIAQQAAPAKTEPVAQRNQSIPTKNTTVRPGVSVAVTEGMQGVSLAESPEKPVAYVLKSGFLINDTYGDPLSPYPTSEYRRKSW